MAIKNTTVGMMKNLVRILKIQDWAKEYPIKTAGVAAVVGFFVGEKVTEIYEEKKNPQIKIKVEPAEPELVTSAPPRSPSHLSEMSSLLLVKGTDLLKDLVYTWFAHEVLSKNKTEKEEESAPVENS